MKEFLYKYKWALAIGLVAFLVRLVYLIELSRQPGFSVPMVDEKWHWEWAHEIIEKSFWGEEAYFRGPLYPYFLALLVYITGSSMFWTKLLQLLVCIGTGFFLFRMSEHLFEKKTAFMAGLIYAFYGPFLFYETMFLIPVVFLFFLVWGMYRVVTYRASPTLKTWLATGLVFGLAAISRPNVLLVIPFLMLWIYFTRPKPAVVWSRIKAPLVLAMGVVLIIMPVTIRNFVVTGEFILISSQGGVNFYIGNNEYANGLSMLMPEVDLTDESLTWRQFIPLTKAAAEKEAGQELSTGEQSSFWTRKALDFILHNPGKFLGLVWKKTVYLLNGFENSDNSDIYYERTKSYLYSALLWQRPFFFPYGLLLPLTLVGVYLRRNDFSKLLPLYIFILAYSPSIILFLVTARHRLPLVPFMIVIASAGVVKLIVQRPPKIDYKKLGISIAIVIVAGLLVNRTYYEEGSPNEFQIHFNNGIKLQQLEDWAGAEKEYLSAEHFYPNSATLLNNLAYVQFQQGKYDEADHNYHRAIRLRPDYARPYNNLGLLVQKKGNLDSALVLFHAARHHYDSLTSQPYELRQIYLNLADVHEDLGNLDSAAIAYIKAIEADPLNGPAYFKAAAFYARYEQYDTADSLFATGRKRGEMTATDCFNWGLSFLERKRYSEGIGMMIRALKRDETLYQAYYCLAVAHFQQEAPRDTVQAYLDLCFKYNPNYEPALELQEVLNQKNH
ncbi:MAG: tetratricopeptide repeat protein [Candidatus Zixiibacteriota bacterium]